MQQSLTENFYLFQIAQLDHSCVKPVVHPCHLCCACYCYNVVCSLVNYICAVDYKLYVPHETMNGFQSRHEIIMLGQEGIRCSNILAARRFFCKRHMVVSKHCLIYISPEWYLSLMIVDGLNMPCQITRVPCIVSSKEHIQMH